MKVCLSDVMQLCCPSCFRREVTAFASAAGTSWKHVMRSKSLTGNSAKSPPRFPTAQNSTSCLSAISPVSGQRPHLCIGASGAPVFILPRIGASVPAFPNKQRLRHLLAGALVLWVAAVTSSK